MLRQAKPASIPVHIITGFLGSGKSTLIQHLAMNKPQDERWVIVINEFGQVGIDQAMFEDYTNIIVKGLPGGCMCCQLAFVLQASLVNLLQRHRPDRLLIEPSGLGHPAGLLELLRGEAFSEALDVQEVITVLDSRRLDDSRCREHDTFQDQLLMAEGVVLNMADLASADQRQAAWRYLDNMWPPKRWVLEAEHGRMPISLLLEGHRHAHDTSGQPVDPTHLAMKQQAPLVSLDTYRYREPSRGQPVFECGESLGYASLGWRWHADDIFCLDALTQVLDRLTAGQRVKGVWHTDVGWQMINRSEGGQTLLSNSAWRRDSRLEVIGPAGSLPDADELQAGLCASLLSAA